MVRLFCSLNLIPIWDFWVRNSLKGDFLSLNLTQFVNSLVWLSSWVLKLEMLLTTCGQGSDPIHCSSASSVQNLKYFDQIDTGASPVLSPESWRPQPLSLRPMTSWRVSTLNIKCIISQNLLSPVSFIRFLHSKVSP